MVAVPQLTWPAFGLMVAVLAAATLRVVSSSTTGSESGQPARIRLSLSARPERVERCRDLSDEELAKLPAHMRLRTQCEGYSARYLMTVSVGEEQLSVDTLRGGGLRNDRPLHVFEEHDVVPGERRVVIEVTRVDETGRTAPDTITPSADTPSDTLLGGRAEREREERSRREAEAMPAHLAIDTTMNLVSGRVILVSFDQLARRLTIRERP